MKQFILVISLFLSTVILHAQLNECEFIKLCSQSEVDAFNTNYGHCTKIHSIEIDDNCDFVYHLDSLYKVEMVNELIIQRMDSLFSISGLDNLKKVGNLRFIQRQPYPPFPKLDTVTYLYHNFANIDQQGDLSLYQNIKHIDTTISLNGDGQFIGIGKFTSSSLFRIFLNNNTKYTNDLTNVAPRGTRRLENLHITNAENISLKGLENIDTIFRLIVSRSKECDISPISKIKHIKVYNLFNIDMSLNKFETFVNVTSVEGLYLNNVTNFFNVEQVLPNLEKVHVGISFVNINDLKNINLFDNFIIPKDLPSKIHLTPGNISARIVLSNNPLLTSCGSPFICKALEVYPDSVLISGNGAGCNKDELLESCISSITEKESFLDIKLYPNPVTNILHIQSDFNIVSVTIRDIVGKEVNNAYDVNFIDLSEVHSGIYIVTIKLKNEAEVVRKICKH